MIRRADIERARGVTAIVDAGILMAYMRAAQELAAGFGKEPYELDVTGVLERWEVAHTTLCGAIARVGATR